MKRPPRSFLAIVLAGLALPPAALACLWDFDTIKMERTRFPGTLELITGKFLRHSPEFYRWRIADRLRRLEARPGDPALMDDLAVAYSKTGQHDKAIETARALEALHPGRYETASNLGTFLFLAGRVEAGLPHIDRALAINPDAHFGRERVQKALGEFIIQRRGSNDSVPPKAESSASPPDTFWRFLFDPKGERRDAAIDEATAVKGVLGMMRFADHDSPVLLEALASLLAPPRAPFEDAKFLATRAYLKLSFGVTDEIDRLIYRSKAKAAIGGQVVRRDRRDSVTLEQVETQFRKELAEADEWYAALRERELSWIRDGKDPEAEFEALYEREPTVSGMEVRDPMFSAEEIEVAALIAVVVAVGLGLLCLLLRWGKRKPA